jgi:hypothetical protein
MNDIFYSYIKGRLGCHLHFKNFTINFHASNIPSNYCINSKYLLTLSSLDNNLSCLSHNENTDSNWSTLKLDNPVSFFIEKYKELVLNVRDI